MHSLLTESGNEYTEPSEIMTKVEGFYANLYKHCSTKTEIFNYLLNALKESFNIGQLSTSQCQAIVTLIEKKERDKRLIKN